MYIKDTCPTGNFSVAKHDNVLTDPKNPDKVYTCKCSKRSIPLISDVELDYFLRLVAPVSQLIVICVINSLHRHTHPYDKMFDVLYKEKNK